MPKRNKVFRYSRKRRKKGTEEKGTDRDLLSRPGGRKEIPGKRGTVRGKGSIDAFPSQERKRNLRKQGEKGKRKARESHNSTTVAERGRRP